MLNLRSIYSTLVLIILVSICSCDDSKSSSDSGPQCYEPINSSSIDIGEIVNGVIPADTTISYRFEIETAGDYELSLTGFSRDLDWYVYSYHGECWEDYTESTSTVSMTIGDGIDEIETYHFNTGTYLVEIEEDDWLADSFTFVINPD